MTAGWINLVVLVAMLSIVSMIGFVFYRAATRRGGKRKPGMAKPSRAHYRKVNPKTGELFP